MALTDFFRINMPYGIVKNSNGEWMAFNREYAPIGWNKEDVFQPVHMDESFSGIPIRTKYKNASESILKELIIDSSSVSYDNEGKIKVIFLYNDETNPTNNEKYWDLYMDKIKVLSKLKTDY